VLREIETGDLLVAGAAETDCGRDHLGQDERDGARPHQRGHHGHQLVAEELEAAAEEQAVGAEVGVDGLLGEEAEQQRPDDPADEVDGTARAYLST
jgi:hypothetical protein